MMEAGAVLVGGHTIQDERAEIRTGGVSGFVHPKKNFQKLRLQTGDKLILTKQIGNGVVNTAIKAEMASQRAIHEAEIVMSSLNKKAKEVVEKYDVSACTDVTGFGLLGHGAEMATASQVCLNLDVRKIPYFEDAKEYAKMGLICGSLQKQKVIPAVM